MLDVVSLGSMDNLHFQTLKDLHANDKQLAWSFDTSFKLRVTPDQRLAKVVSLVNKGDKCALGMYMAMSDLSNI